ncbi:TetR/AcrR family transcriptional regulator [Variovorax sp. GB1R11]|uniref:TetR/AcrR family transcriptional regulator n=1 Tax=Variovorax sp. GB1R11 TaxID=3443741 RepID=UPI003F459975
MTEATDTDPTAPVADTPRKAPARVVNPEANRQNIIEVATAEFSEHGLAGARVDEIASKTDCSKRLIYYYFGDKEGLYLAVLEHVYRRVRSVESGLRFDTLEPVEALRRMVEFRFDHHFQNRDFVRLVMIENIHNARFLKQSQTIHDLSAAAVERVARIYLRGVEAGVFGGGLQPVDIHWQISAMSFYNVSNRATFSTLFGSELDTPESIARLRHNTVECILRFVASDKNHSNSKTTP